MKIAVYCDIVRNDNQKSKRFGQCGIVLTTSTSCAYVNYQDGFTAYCAVNHLTLVWYIDSIGEALNLLMRTTT